MREVRVRKSATFSMGLVSLVTVLTALVLIYHSNKKFNVISHVPGNTPPILAGVN